MSPVDTLELLLLLMGAAVLLAVLARRVHVPPAAAFVVGGLALAVVPGVPPFQMDPGLIMALFLPPLLSASAWFTNWHLFRNNLRPILLLAIGCVGFTTVVVGVVAHALAPDLPWTACFVLGAIVSPPDAVSAAAVLQRVRLPRRLVAILEGESLVNDASGLVLYRMGLAAALGQVVGPWQGAASFVWVAAGGIAVGIAFSFAWHAIGSRLRDANLEIALSFIVAYASYIGAERLELSGVLSTVACGLVMGQRQHRTVSAETRMQANATWSFVTFVLEAFVFVLIGLSLHGVLSRFGPGRAMALLPLAAGVVVAVVLARVAWVVPVANLPRLVPIWQRASPAPPWRITTEICWAGMRGVVSLAAALAIPDGLPWRDTVLFATFAAIVVTVLVQGTTLGPLITTLGVSSLAADESGAEIEVRTALLEAEIRALEARASDPSDGAIAQAVLVEVRAMARLVATDRPLAGLQARQTVKLHATAARRTALIVLHRERHFSDELLHALEHEIDLEELRLRRREA